MSNILNNSTNIPGIQEIVELAKLLRQSGDKVLSASSKLSLSTIQLHNLNEAFSLIVNKTEDLESSFQVCNSSRNEIFMDIKFLHDFVQKTIGLKITHNLNDSKVHIDITKFRHLRYLELQKVCIESVKGLQGIRGQLECVVCAGGKGVSSLNCLLASCGGDSGIRFVWNSLLRLLLPYNTLEHLDKSLELVPWLQTLDLSHNLITKANELECLPNLKYLNLGYNKLESIPTFHKLTFLTLQKLILKNNYIENINELQGLEYLVELDLSYNCLMQHSVLSPLETMSALLWVSLEGNPLSYHPNHRLFSIKHLHPSVASTKFVLDRLQLSRTEKYIVSENRIFSMRSMRSASRDKPASVRSSISSEVASTSLNTSISLETCHKSQLSNSLEGIEDSTTTKIKKRQHVKEAIITDDNEENADFMLKSINLSSSYKGSSVDHLETKKQILALREKFGENNWLISHAGTHIQNIMGLPQSTAILYSTFNDRGTNIIAPSALSASLTQSTDFGSLSSNNSMGAMCAEGATRNNETEQDKTNDRSVLEDSNVDSNTISEIDQMMEEVPETIYDPEDEKGNLYLVQKRKNKDEIEDIFLIITPDDIIERDSISGKIKFRWATSTVLSCVMGRDKPITVDIIFDTSRKDRQNRTYLAESDDAKKIVETLSEMLIAKPILLKVFKCMKCSTHFSQDVDGSTIITISTIGTKSPKCPTCQSTLVIETDDLSTPAMDTEKNILPSKVTQESTDLNFESSMETHLQHSASHSSIGGTEGEAILVTTSPVHSIKSHSHAQICRSATSLEESRESTPSASVHTRKYESDIEILSNPSQSSIEVLDEGSRSNSTPKRKRSSEERRVAVAPSLLTIPDTTPVMAGLTESSSSGSLTDSVCTAYENRATKLSEISEMSNHENNDVGEMTVNTVLDKEKVFAPVTNLTSMLGGLLQSMKIGTTNDVLQKSEEGSEFTRNNIQYSYTDFKSVDHRIKLHIILHIFEYENEELVLLLRAEILRQISTNMFPGLLIMSTAKVYVLRIDGSEGEDPQRWLKKEVSWTIDRLRSFAPLPFKQGVLVKLQQPSKLGEESSNTTLLCILQDFQRTSNFLFYLTDSPLPANFEIECSVPQHCNDAVKNVLMSSKYYRDVDHVRILAIPTTATFRNHTIISLKICGLVVTSSALIVLEDKMHWLLPDTKENPKIVMEQTISNLIEVEFCGSILHLSFLDEVVGTEETWILEFVSNAASEAIVDSIRSPWEELFSVPLQVNTRVDELTRY